MKKSTITRTAALIAMVGCAAAFLTVAAGAAYIVDPSKVSPPLIYRYPNDDGGGEETTDPADGGTTEPADESTTEPEGNGGGVPSRAVSVPETNTGDSAETGEPETAADEPAVEETTIGESAGEETDEPEPVLPPNGVDTDVDIGVPVPDTVDETDDRSPSTGVSDVTAVLLTAAVTAVLVTCRKRK